MTYLTLCAPYTMPIRTNEMNDSLVPGHNTLFIELSPEQVLSAIERGIASDDPLSKTYGNRINFSTSIKGNKFEIGKRYKPKQCFSRTLHGHVSENGAGSVVTYRFALSKYFFAFTLPITLLVVFSCLAASLSQAHRTPQFSFGFAVLALLLLLSTPMARCHEETTLAKYLKGILEGRS